MESLRKQWREKPFYRRWWFYGPIALIAVAVLTGWLFWIFLNVRFEQRAAEFDLTQLERMEAASIIYDRQGKELGKIFIQNRNPVSLDKISPAMVKAVVAAEDNKFFQHHGVDYIGVLRAALANYRRGKISQGASTVTQQLARNSFELRERTYQRKFVEMFLAQRIEQKFTKGKIMELYLNRVYFGSGFYGVEAAARGYFGRSAKDLDIGQCAMLAGLLKSPQTLSPWNNKEGAKIARDFVLKRMREQGLISKADFKEQIGLPLYAIKRTNPFKVSYAIDYIRQQAIAALGYRRAMNGGFHIYTTLDLKLQRASELAVRELLTKVETQPGYDHVTFEDYRKLAKPIEDELNRGNLLLKLPEPKYLQGAVLALENSTGGILAMVGGRDFKHSEYNRATMARRPLGTAFTPFVYAAAYEKGIFPGSSVDDSCLDNRYVMVGGDSGILGEWGVEREENEYEGPIPAGDALAQGKNAATVRLGLRVGLDQVKSTALNAGISSPLRNYANAFLGSSEATLEEITLGYTVFANGGSRAKQPHIIAKIANAEGKQIFKAEPQSVKALSREAAWQVTEGLEAALRTSAASIAFTQFGLKDMPVAGKTGTAYNFTDTYFLGYSNSVTCGVWVGFDRPTRIFRGAFGKDLALPIWTKVMNVASEEFPPVKFDRPNTLKAVEICRRSGLLATPRCHREANGDGPGSGTFNEYGTEAQIPKGRCDIHGGGVRSYAREYDQDEWPRAAAAIDLSTVRPVAVMTPTVLGLNDVYGAVRPAGFPFEDAIPIARAIPVNAADVQEASNAVAKTSEAQPTEVPGSAEPEVRKAEAVRPLDSPLDAPSIQAPTPEPITF